MNKLVTTDAGSSQLPLSNHIRIDSMNGAIPTPAFSYKMLHASSVHIILIIYIVEELTKKALRSVLPDGAVLELGPHDAWYVFVVRQV